MGKSRNGLFMECGVDRGDPCVVCAYSRPTVFGLSNVAADATMAKFAAKTYYSVSGWVEEEYHSVDVENYTGEGTHKERWRCEGRGCEYCAKKYPKVYGTRMYMEVSPGQWRGAFQDLHKKIENRYCRCGGTIYVPNFTCAGCGEFLLDVCTYCSCGSGDVALDVDQGQAVCGGCGASWSAFYTEHPKVYEASNEPHVCPNCRHKGFPKPTRICSTEGCEVSPYSVFDCQLTVRVTGTKKEKRLIIDNYKIQEPDPRLFDPSLQGDNEWGPIMAEAHRSPINLEEVLKSKSVDDQCLALEKANPFTAAARGGQRFAKYQGPQSQDTESAE